MNQSSKQNIEKGKLPCNSGKPINFLNFKKIIMKNTLTILLFMTTGFSFGQINNGGFEVWDTVYTNIYSSELNSTFGVPNPLGGGINGWTSNNGNFGVSRTTDSYSGNNSLIIHNWYSYVYQSVFYNDTCSFSPQFVQGFYKYITGNTSGLSHGSAIVTLTRFNGIENDTVATGNYNFDTASVYMAFQIPLNYISTFAPDSIHINIANGNTQCAGGNVCNLLYLDDLTLSGTPLAVQNISSDDLVISGYPNPTSTLINLKTDTKLLGSVFTIYDNTGRLMMSGTINSKNTTVNLSNFSDGVYLFRVGENLKQTFKIIKE